MKLKNSSGRSLFLNHMQRKNIQWNKIERCRIYKINNINIGYSRFVLGIGQLYFNEIHQMYGTSHEYVHHFIVPLKIPFLSHVVHIPTTELPAGEYFLNMLSNRNVTNICINGLHQYGHVSSHSQESMPGPTTQHAAVNGRPFQERLPHPTTMLPLVYQIPLVGQHKESYRKHYCSHDDESQHDQHTQFDSLHHIQFV